MPTPFISICIPAYKRTPYLGRLLDSIRDQEYRSFEVIITDDSPDDAVETLAKGYEGHFILRYFKNSASLGTPANWNESISKAKGEWIKLMHDDDWFAEPSSLTAFASRGGGDTKFVFSGYNNIYEGTERPDRKFHLSPAMAARLRKDSSILMLENVIGPPSVTMIHRSVMVPYDDRLKWRVDTDLYLELLKTTGFEFFTSPAINIGISDSQVTQLCINNPAIELPEAYILIQKHGTSNLKTIRGYDAWWRLMRNMKINSEEKLRRYSNYEWPGDILRIIRDIARAPESIYRSGIISKAYMTKSFFGK